ncbi:MAG: MotA/TolQ/ExbB proton channel family protein [Deltaproteobacteria bacterium]|nr:MotA/TolQ/ExbB proton channel family protein [Deltaproteobacteria bacterium]
MGPMRLAERLLGLTLIGADWVFWILIGLSVLSVAVMVERAIRFSGKAMDLDALGNELIDRLSTGDVSAARQTLGSTRSPESDVVMSGIVHFERGAGAVSAAMAAARSRLRLDLERNLGILGTLGNNAPFIGLFGTVLGIIKAFADLARNQGGGITVVMTGIAEALVATALGLLVAIPAVIAFNFFQGRIRRILGRVDAAANVVMVAMWGADHKTKSADQG